MHDARKKIHSYWARTGREDAVAQPAPQTYAQARTARDLLGPDALPDPIDDAMRDTNAPDTNGRDTDDIEINVLTSELLDSMVGRRVVVNNRAVIKPMRGCEGRIVRWKHSRTVESEVLFYIRLKNGEIKCAGFYALSFPIEPLSTEAGAPSAEGRAHA